MFWRIGWQQSSKRPQGLGWSCTYRILLAIWCLQGTARSTGLGLGRVRFILSPLRCCYWCIPVTRRSWASGSSSVSDQFSDVAPATVRGRNGSPEPQRCPRPGVRASFPALMRAVRSVQPSMHCEVPGPILVQPSGCRVGRPSFIAHTCPSCVSPLLQFNIVGDDIRLFASGIHRVFGKHLLTRPAEMKALRLNPKLSSCRLEAGREGKDLG